MPTYDQTDEFRRDYKRLTDDQKDLFDTAVTKFVDSLRTGQFRSGLRVKGYQGADNTFEMTWAPNGRALFRYGTPIKGAEPHVIWLRIGTHDIF